MGPPALDARSCLAEQSCLPLGGQSVWAPLGALNATRPPIFAVAPLDAAALIHEAAAGGDATVSGLVALLAAAEALGRTPSAATLPLGIIFAAFEAEAWGR
jgi:nicastrin